MVSVAQRLAKLQRRRSKYAEWCQRLALFAIPYMAIAILGHRLGYFDTLSTYWLLGIGLLILVAAVVLGIRGFYDLWSRGEKGGLKSARGTVLALLLLLPFVYHGFLAYALPPLYDISTDLDDPPVYEFALEDRVEPMNEIEKPSDYQKQLQLRSYPRVVARRYALGAGRVFRAVAELAKDRDWVIQTVQAEVGNAAIDEEGSALVAQPTVDHEGRPLRIPLPARRPNVLPDTDFGLPFESIEVSPTGREDDSDASIAEERYIEAVASSAIFGFKSDVVFRIIEEEQGTLIDMRSNSRWGPHDLGSNARRIVDFMRDLDIALQGLGPNS